MSTISIIIPIKPGLEPKALQRMEVVDWPPERLELLVAEGTNPSQQRNQAVQQTTGEIIYFLDDDSLVAPDVLRRLERHFSDPHVIAVGGPSLTPVSDTLLQRAFGAVLSSLLGAGGARNRYRAAGSVRQTTERELILCNLAFRRSTFLVNDGFDERLYPNEENELLDRLRKGGGVLLHDPQLAVERSQRSNIAAFCKQLFRYGRGRAEQTRIAGYSGLMPFAPLVFLLYLLILPLMQSLICWGPLMAYLAAVSVSAVFAAVREREARLLLLLPVLFPLLHISNGIGLLAGFMLPLKRQTCYNLQPVTVRRLQPETDPQTPGVLRWT